ncbi:MAG: hypothetical protein R2816_10980 [Flavobacteriaceae bacterium]|nr:hypothetical protein [Flavobacteriaceae bacterium]
MRKFPVLFICCLILFNSCDDGDVITVELDFDKTLALCGDTNSINYVVYDIKTDPNESLTLLFPSNSTTDKIFNPTTTPHTYEGTINNTSVRFNYRTYDGDPSGLICEEIPDADVSIIEDYPAQGGTFMTETTFVDDDEDGIPSEQEDINNNGNLEDDDTDGDGIPNYKDNDDDNDNVLTIDENPDLNDDGLIDDAQDTDGDTIPDYLDTDDDNDGTITRYEDENLNKNLQDDFADGSVIRRYLDPAANDVFVQDELNTNTFKRFITVTFNILDTDLGILNTDLIELGTYTDEKDIEN